MVRRRTKRRGSGSLGRVYGALAMIELRRAGSDILAELDGVDAVCIPVNTHAVPGAGLAKAAARRWPKWAASYRDCCRLGRMSGPQYEVHAIPLPAPPAQLELPGVGRQRAIHVVSLPTKYHWREPSTLDLVAESIRRLCDSALRRPWHTVAVPALGCGLGGLEWPRVLRLMQAEMDTHPSTFLVFPPESA